MGSSRARRSQTPTAQRKSPWPCRTIRTVPRRLKNRFTADYSAGAEVTTVLKQSTAIDAFMQRSANTMKGRSEWDRLAAQLKHLAEAYGARFPCRTARRRAG